MCFAILPFALDDIYGRVGSIALIVSPYKVLMKDQVRLLVPTLMVKFTVGMACMQVSSLSSRGLSAAYVIGETDGIFNLERIYWHESFVQSPEPFHFDLCKTRRTWHYMVDTMGTWRYMVDTIGTWRYGGHHAWVHGTMVDIMGTWWTSWVHGTMVDIMGTWWTSWVHGGHHGYMVDIMGTCMAL